MDDVILKACPFRRHLSRQPSAHKKTASLPFRYSSRVPHSPSRENSRFTGRRRDHFLVPCRTALRVEERPMLFRRPKLLYFCCCWRSRSFFNCWCCWCFFNCCCWSRWCNFNCRCWSNYTASGSCTSTACAARRTTAAFTDWSSFAASWCWCTAGWLWLAALHPGWLAPCWLATFVTGISTVGEQHGCQREDKTNCSHRKTLCNDMADSQPSARTGQWKTLPSRADPLKLQHTLSSQALPCQTTRPIFTIRTIPTKWSD